ncbi:MAG: NUDIX domain-containing protein [Anaerolineales bacterium]|nr:NUDIX domain-containing protein [Anaerolineales bacterium]
MHLHHHVNIAASTVVRDDNGHILMQKREDFRVWTIPGGKLDYDETLEQAAHRETFEETGIEIELDGLQGVFYINWFGQTHLSFVYYGHPVGGQLTTSFESVDVRYFDPTHLPERVISNTRERIAYALAGQHNLLAVQTLPTWQRLLLPTFFGLRNLRNRYILKRPTPDPSPYAVQFKHGDKCANATTGEIPWRALENQISRPLQHVHSVETDPDQRLVVISVD